MSYLAQAIERFLVSKALEKQSATQSALLLSELRERGLDKAFQQHYRKATTSLETKQTRDPNYFRERLRLEEALFQHSTRAGGRSTADILQRVVHTMDTAYRTTRLKYSCELLNRQNVLSDETALPTADAFVASLKPAEIASEPTLAAYYHIYHTLAEGPQETHFKQLKAVLQEHPTRFSDRELRDIYVFAQNFCIRQINMGHTQYLQELYDTYRVLLEKGLLLDSGTLAQFHFKNIVTVALRLGEYDWVEQFIAQNSRHVEQALRKNAENYNLASLHFARKAYGKARRLLLEVEFTDVYYHLDSKALLLKTYYELDEVEPLISLVATFRTYLRRNRKISDYQRKTYLNMVKFVLKLVRVKLGSRKPLAEIEAEMRAVKQIADLTWLQAKTLELAT